MTNKRQICIVRISYTYFIQRSGRFSVTYEQFRRKPQYERILPNKSKSHVRPLNNTTQQQSITGTDLPTRKRISEKGNIDEIRNKCTFAHGGFVLPPENRGI